MAISQEEIATLDRVRKLPEGPKVLSIFMALKPSRNVDFAHTPELTRLIRELREDLDEAEIESFEAEAQRCLDFIRGEFEPSGRTLLMFSSTPRNLWVAQQIQAELPSRAQYGPRPFLLPLLAEPTLERRAVVTIDSENARLLTTRLGELESEEDIKDYVPRGTRQMGRKHQTRGAMGNERAGGTPSFHEDQSIDEWVAEHYRNVLDALEDLYESRPFERLAVGGTSENAARLLDMLPEHFGSMVAGTFPVEPYAPSHELLEQAAPIFRDRRDAEDREAIERAEELSGAGGAATRGWEDTLSALQQGRVMHLLLPPETDATGLICRDGHYVGVEAHTCPVCGRQLREVADLPALAARLAQDTDAQLSYLSPEAAERLAGLGGVAALLRY